MVPELQEARLNLIVSRGTKNWRLNHLYVLRESLSSNDNPRKGRAGPQGSAIVRQEPILRISKARYPLQWF